jgi:ubiquinone/menaquinone biosynthesis C-methylase UbiE
MLKRLSSILRPALVLSAVFLVVGFAGITYQGIRTLQKLTVAEDERDTWQRADDVIRPLNLKDGSVVVDFGSGAGYFSLKLSQAVGSTGEVIAVDLRRLSLLFLRMRAFLKGKNNVQTIVDEPNDPHLPAIPLDAVLIANTYHELSDPKSILRHISRTLRPGGRIVIIDPAPHHEEASGIEEHRMPSKMVEGEMRTEGFEIISCEDSFVRPPEQDPWWFIVATKP